MALGSLVIRSDKVRFFIAVFLRSERLHPRAVQGARAARGRPAQPRGGVRQEERRVQTQLPEQPLRHVGGHAAGGGDRLTGEGVLQYNSETPVFTARLQKERKNK